MPYAIIQIDLTPPPPVEALRQAFAEAKTIRPADAPVLARESYGILAEHLPAPEALTISGLLKELGVATEVVNQADIPVLPPPVHTGRVDCLAEGLAVYDALGRQTLINWPEVMVVAAGRVGLIDLVQQEAKYFPQDQAAAFALGMGVSGYSRQRRNSRYKETPRGHLLLDLILQGSRRYRADASRLNYGYLGPRQKSTAAENFKLLVGDLARLARSASLNRGAEAICMDFAYPTRQAFERETIWRLWKRAREHRDAGK